VFLGINQSFCPDFSIGIHLDERKVLSIKTKNTLPTSYNFTT
jgi:hypothetical protein